MFPQKHCPYPGCELHCSSIKHHRAKYAYISETWKLPEKPKRSTRINWENVVINYQDNYPSSD